MRKRSFSRRFASPAEWTSTFARRTYNDGKYQAPPFEMLETK